MSKERELLNRSRYNLDREYCADLIDEIHELLAQPEYEADRRSDPISKLRNLRDIQGRKGNYDIDEYMRGLYNGLELSLSIFEDRGPDYKEPIAQPEVEPLSEQEITDLWANKSPANEFECVRLVEKAHGITGVDDE